MSALRPSLLSQLACLLADADAVRAWDTALAELARHGSIQLAADSGTTAWLSLVAGERTLHLSAPDPRPNDAEREPLAALLQLGLWRRLESQEREHVRERMEMLYQSSFEGLFFHVDGIVIDVNRRLTEMVGYSYDELLGPNTVQRCVAPEDQAYVKKRVAEQHEGGYVITLVRKDGSRFRAELSSTMGTLGERPVRVAAVRDVTERERTVTLLRESEQRLRELAQATFDATVISRDGVVLDVWGSSAALIGHTREAMIGRHSLEFVAAPARALAQQMVSQQRVGAYETLLQAASGELVPVEIVAVMSTLKGEPVRVAAIRDLREVRRLQGEHRLLEQQMERSQRLESLGVLAGGIAHDFNNLLLGVMGNAELLLERLAEERDRGAARAIISAAERAGNLTAQMLAYAGRGQLGPRGPVDVGALLSELRTLLDASLSRKALLTLSIAQNPIVYGDRATLTQVLMNLLTNASDALEDRAGSIEVRVERVREPGTRFRQALGKPVGPGDWVLVEVKDSGRGMDAETLGRVFEPFFTTKDKGHGLGLAACVGIVSSHGGAILVESEPDRGSTFSVLLPGSQIALPHVPIPARGRQAGAQSALVIDDQPMVRAYLRQALTRLGYRSEEASDGESGLARLAKEGIDVVILDMTMPDLSGAEVLARLRARGSTVPVILVSGYHDLAAQLDSSTFQGFLVKPFGITQLAKALEQAMQG